MQRPSDLSEHGHLTLVVKRPSRFAWVAVGARPLSAMKLCRGHPRGNISGRDSFGGAIDASARQVHHAVSGIEEQGHYTLGVDTNYFERLRASVV